MKSLTLACHEVSQTPRPAKLHAMDGSFDNSGSRATDEHPKEESASLPVFNAEAALARVEGNRDLLRGMAGLFALQWKNLCAEIANAGKQRDGAKLELTANVLKKSAESLGASRTSRLAQDLETRALESDFHEIEKTCARLQLEVEHLVKALKAFSDEAKP
ncbi:MAG: Hpt domain-containing protein [Gemmataceae bacterium]